MQKIYYAALSLLGLILLGTLWASIFYPESNWQTDVQIAMQGPSTGHWFGTDSLGRDLLLRILHGAKMTLFMGMFCGFVSLTIGVIYGGVSAFLGGVIDQIMMRIMEIMISLPPLITIGLIVLFFGGSLAGFAGVVKLSVAIALGSWMVFARLTRNLVIKEKSLQYVEAAVALGSTPWRIFWREIGPNLAPSLLIMFGLQIPNFLLFEGLLSFMGLGLQPPTSSWGLLIQEGWHSMVAYPHALLFPSLVLFLSVFSLNVIFERLRKRVLRSFEPVDTHQ